MSRFMHAADAAQPQALRRLVVGLVLLTLLAMALSLSVGSQGWEPLLFEAPWPISSQAEASPLQTMAHQILWEIRLPRTLGTWLAGALLGLSGALAQGLFRNPLADPYLLGSSSGAALGVALCMAAFGLSPMGMAWWGRMGLTGAAFVGGLLAVLLTLLLARGVAHTLRLLLAGVVVGVVLGALSAMTMLLVPDIMRPRATTSMARRSSPPPSAWPSQDTKRARSRSGQSARARSCQSTCPVQACRPAITLSRVDLPAPLGPTMAVQRPGARRKDTLCKAKASPCRGHCTHTL